jgi:hypothetical protein
VRQMSLKRRKCISQGDSNLEIKRVFKTEMSFFEEYTQANCIMKCRAKLVLDACHCIPFYWSHLGQEYKNKSCDKAGHSCLSGKGCA